MTRKYDMAVFIGRFQPWHNGHQKILNEAFKQAERVLVIIGSCGGPRSLRNPFTFEERKQMIQLSNPGRQIIIAVLEDTIYNDQKWVKDVQRIVNAAMGNPGERIALIGHSKDKSSFYLKLFPQWANINVGGYINEQFVIAATTIREDYFGSKHDIRKLQHTLVPASTYDFMTEFAYTADYRTIRDEYEFVAKYKQSWAAAPYAPTFVTTDAVVVQSGHVLLVERGAQPGKGLWALPGGFLEQDERTEDGMLRELKEETKIKVPVPVLRGSIVNSKVFDDPHRSSRGRTITHAFLIHLPPDVVLPKVKGSDDAATARWFPLSAVTRKMMFEDHFCIIAAMVDLLS